VTNGGLTVPTGYLASQLVFSDYFTGTALDTTKWVAAMAEPQFGIWSDQGKLPAPYSALTNDSPNEVNDEYVDPAMVVVNNGLDLQLAPSSLFAADEYHWKAGCISTWSKWAFPAGKRVYVQVRALCDAGLAKGGWPAIWFMGVAGASEKDLFEGGYTAAGNPLEVLAFNEHTSNQQDVQLAPGGVDLTKGFNVWGMEYDPKVPRVRYYFNGTLCKEYDAPIGLGTYVIIINYSMATTATNGWHSQPVAGDTSTYHFKVSGVEAYAQ